MDRISTVVNGINHSSSLERLHVALANGAEVVTEPRDIRGGCIYFARKKHVSRTLLAAAVWSVWGGVEYRTPWLLGLVDWMSSAFPKSVQKRWQYLRAYKYNGSAYARDALNRGAALVVMEHGGIADQRVVRVADVGKVLYAFAREHRLRQKVKVIGITGSCGKTTTKEYLAHILSSHFNVVSTEDSFNTFEGVCLTLLKIKQDTDFAVLEISSAGPNDVEDKARIVCPDFAIITVIGKAHLDGFGGIEGVREVKRKLFDVCVESKGCLVVNQDDPVIVELAGSYPKVRRYGSSDDCDIWGCAVPGRMPLEICWKSKGSSLRRVSTQIFGTLNLPNLLAAITVAHHVGVPTEMIDTSISDYVPNNMRSQLVSFGDVNVILDAYNSNPTSLHAALNDFNTTVEGHRTVILGDMLELGAHSEVEHTLVVDFLKSAGFDSIYLVGPEFGKVLGKELDVSWFPNVEALLEQVLKDGLSETTVLIKGSRGMQLELLFQSLEELHTSV